MQYPIVIHKDKTSNFGVIVPDLSGCYSAGNSLSEALTNAREAIECHLEGLLIDNEPMPESTSFENYVHLAEYKEGIWFLVEIDLAKLSGKSRRVNITLPERIIRYIDKYTNTHGLNRSEFLANAAMRFISKDKS